MLCLSELPKPASRSKRSSLPQDPAGDSIAVPIPIHNSPLAIPPLCPTEQVTELINSCLSMPSMFKSYQPGKDPNADAHADEPLLSSILLCLLSPCLAALARRKARQLPRWGDQPEHPLCAALLPDGCSLSLESSVLFLCKTWRRQLLLGKLLLCLIRLSSHAAVMPSIVALHAYMQALAEPYACMKSSSA